MRWWILNDNLESYKHLCEDESIVPIVIDHRDNKSLVDMTVHMSSVWNMRGHWYELDKQTFSFDKIEWEKLSEEEQTRWLDWAESCGTGREVNPVVRNPNYPDLVCYPAVSIQLPDEAILKILEICEDPPPFSEHLRKHLKNSS